MISAIQNFRKLTNRKGKSLEQIDDIFGDVKPIVERIDRVSSNEKEVVETVYVTGAKFHAKREGLV